MSPDRNNDLSYLDDPAKNANQFQLLSNVSSGLNNLRAAVGREKAPLLWATDDTDKKMPDNR